MSKIFLGVGHGGSDPGAVGILTEKTVNLEMALACRDVLTRYGVQVMLSRDRDKDDSLQSRIKKLYIGAESNIKSNKIFI